MSPLASFQFCLKPKLKSLAYMWHSNVSGLHYVGYSISDQNCWMSWGGMCTGCSLCPSQLCWCAACATHCLLHLLGRSIWHNCHCSSFCFIVVLCRVIASPSRLSIIHWCVSCFVLLCSVFPPPPSSCLGCLYLGPYVFSAVPVPPPPGVNIEEHIQIRQEEKRQRINRRHRLEEGRGMEQG